jgi:hypothetical protein
MYFGGASLTARRHQWAFVSIGQSFDKFAQPGGVVDPGNAAPGMHHGVIPGRYHFPVFRLEGYQFGEM